MLDADLFVRLPPATALLLLSSIFGLGNAAYFPRQTKTVEYHELNVLPWPSLPTPAPISPAELSELRRRQEENTVCGFLGGDAGLPATCSAGSHCVVDPGAGVIGCCPNGGACTTGVFTGCVDFNSGPQTEVNPYIFTCAGSDVCYKNSFEGGFSQFGCGTDTNLATSVATRASGVTSQLRITSLSLALTATPISLSEPTTINPSTGTKSFTLSSQSSSSSQTSSLSSTSSSTSITSSSSSRSSTTSTRTSTSVSRSASSTTVPATEAPVADSSGGVDRTGAIVGGTISGVAILIAIIAVGIYLWRRKRGNKRQGPGATVNTQYISPMSRDAFAPLPSSQEMWEQSGGDHYMSENHGTTTSIRGGKGISTPLGSFYPQSGYNYGPGGGVVAAGANTQLEHDQVPLTHEIEDFSRGFNDALTRIDEEPDSRPGTGVNTGGMSGHGNGYGAGADSLDRDGQPSNSEQPLWQQNRRQSRNLMWM